MDTHKRHRKLHKRLRKQERGEYEAYNCEPQRGGPTIEPKADRNAIQFDVDRKKKRTSREHNQPESERKLPMPYILTEMKQLNNVIWGSIFSSFL